MARSPAAAFGPTAPDPQPFFDAILIFLAAANSPGAESATRTFADFLRDQYATAGTSWSGAAPPFPGTSANAGPSMGFHAIGPTRQYQERTQRLAETALRYAEAQRRLQRLCSDLLREAATAFAAQTLSTVPDHPNTETLHGLFDQWIDCAEEAYSHAAQGESFCNALAESVNAMSEWRRDMQSNFEEAAKLFDLPTRSELDSLARRVRALEAELRAARVSRKPPKTIKRRGARATSKR